MHCPDGATFLLPEEKKMHNSHKIPDRSLNKGLMFIWKSLWSTKGRLYLHYNWYVAKSWRKTLYLYVQCSIPIWKIPYLFLFPLILVTSGIPLYKSYRILPLKNNLIGLTIVLQFEKDYHLALILIYTMKNKIPLFLFLFFSIRIRLYTRNTARTRTVHTDITTKTIMTVGNTPSDCSLLEKKM